LCHLARYRGEHVLWRRSFGNERRNSAQRRLFVGQPAKILPRLSRGDRRRHQLGETSQTVLGARRQLGVIRAGGHYAPNLPIDNDRGTRTATDEYVAYGFGDAAGQIREVVNPRRPTGP
jgi:hypothetical protein